MKERTKKILPIAIIAGIAAIIIAIMVIVIEARKPRETRAPATIAVYYTRDKSEIGDWTKRKLLYEIKRTNYEKSYEDLGTIRVTLPYTGKEYGIVFRLLTDTTEHYGDSDWEEGRAYYVDSNGNNMVHEFTEVKEKGDYGYWVTIKTQSDALLPLDATFVITIE